MSLAPIFPSEARSRGISLPMIGLIYAAYSISNTLMAPIVGLTLGSVGRRRYVFTGMCCLFISMTMFGCVPLIDIHLTNFNEDEFIIVTLLARLIQGMGVACI
jgi:MFS family permease